MKDCHLVSPGNLDKCIPKPIDSQLPGQFLKIAPVQNVHHTSIISGDMNSISVFFFSEFPEDFETTDQDSLQVYHCKLIILSV